MKMLEVGITYTTENKDTVEFAISQLLPNYEIIVVFPFSSLYFYIFSSPFMGLETNRSTLIASALSHRKRL